MRKIKFKCYDKIKKKFVNADEIPINSDTDIFLAGGWQDYELLLFAGLKDANGKEIYEGDIIEDEYGQRGFIEWIKKEAAFAIQTGLPEIFTVGKYIKTFKIKIIGNVFETPGLLAKEGEK